MVFGNLELGGTMPGEGQVRKKNILKWHLNACAGGELQGTETKVTETGRADENLMDKFCF